MLQRIRRFREALRRFTFSQNAKFANLHGMIGLMLNGLYLLTLFAATPWMAYRAVRTGRYREGWGSKLFGFVPMLRKKNAIWFHAVSVGEVQVLRPMLADMRRRYPIAPSAFPAQRKRVLNSLASSSLTTSISTSRWISHGQCEGPFSVFSRN